jgi:glycosyltransferase involved in cell wall biosynthesis
MRILFLTYFRRKVGGTESYLNAIIPAYRRRGHAVSVCYTDEGPTNRQPFEFADEIPQWRLEMLGHEATLGQIKDWRPDLIFCHGTTDLKFEAEILELAPGIFFAHNYYGTCISGLKTQKFPVPVPCTRVFGPGCLLQYFPRGCGGRSPVTMIKLYSDQAQRLRILRSYAVIATNSEHLSAEYDRHGFNTHRLPYPVFADDSERPRVAKPDSQERWQLLFVGRMDKLKGGLLLLDALPEIRNGADRAVELVFAGDGPERIRWQRKAAQVESDAKGIHVTFKGWLDKTALNLAISQADLLVVPSLWPEPCGVVGVEAGLYSIPAAAFSVGGIPEWLKDGENGYLAPGNPATPSGLASAVVRALAPENYERLCAGARRLALNWTLDRHCDAFDRLVEKVMKTSALQTHAEPAQDAVPI